MDFVKSHFGKMQLWQVEHFFLHKKIPVVLYNLASMFSEPPSESKRPGNNQTIEKLGKYILAWLLVE